VVAVHVALVAKVIDDLARVEGKSAKGIFDVNLGENVIQIPARLLAATVDAGSAKTNCIRAEPEVARGSSRSSRHGKGGILLRAPEVLKK